MYFLNIILREKKNGSQYWEWGQRGSYKIVCPPTRPSSCRPPLYLRIRQLQHFQDSTAATRASCGPMLDAQVQPVGWRQERPCVGDSACRCEHQNIEVGVGLSGWRGGCGRGSQNKKHNKLLYCHTPSKTNFTPTKLKWHRHGGGFTPNDQLL